jgi:ABC-type lipoprotein release transport system permease subunit
LLLAGLFFALAVEQRTREIGLLGAVGFARGDVARLLFWEAMTLALIGSAIGAAGAVGYAALIMHGLRTWWRDAVGTSALTLHVDWVLLVGGAAAALAAAGIALWLSLRTALARSPRALLTGEANPASALRERRPLTASASAIVALTLLVATMSGVVPQVAGFFGTGGALMIAGLAGLDWWLRRPARLATRGSLVQFGSAYARWRPTRSVLSAALITFACFVIVSVGAFRRDANAPLTRNSGTGGFVLMAESVAPLMHNPNSSTGREELGLPDTSLPDGTHVSRFRLKPGDDASCLTLYRPRNPRIIAPEDAFVEEARFRFAASLADTPDERQNPWRLLRRRFSDGAIPAIADQTSLTYVFHLAVGDDFVFTADNGREVRLRIVGALADSLLQSELIIPETAFVDLFPQREGYSLWLVEAPAESAATLTTVLEDRLADYGVDVMDTRARLASYHRVENTYLSTFQALGALGLLLGTIGLAAVLARNVLERRRELALLQAVGFTSHNLRTIVLSESLVLVGAGLVLGTFTALVAVTPALVERTTAVPLGMLAALLLTVTITAVLSAAVAARVAGSSRVTTALKSD